CARGLLKGCYAVDYW
nr:immunoglobulin heavy chain junction region [Mus musculus]